MEVNEPRLPAGIKLNEWTWESGLVGGELETVEADRLYIIVGGPRFDEPRQLHGAFVLRHIIHGRQDVRDPLFVLAREPHHCIEVVRDDERAVLLYLLGNKLLPRLIVRLLSGRVENRLNLGDPNGNDVALGGSTRMIFQVNPHITERRGRIANRERRHGKTPLIASMRARLEALGRRSNPAG